MTEGRRIRLELGGLVVALLLAACGEDSSPDGSSSAGSSAELPGWDCTFTPGESGSADACDCYRSPSTDGDVCPATGDFVCCALTSDSVCQCRGGSSCRLSGESVDRCPP